MTRGRFPPYRVIPVADVRPYPRNARTHSAEQVAKLVRSIGEFGFTAPLLVEPARPDGWDLIAGHARLEAARQIGLTEVPAIVLAGLTRAQKRALVLADNRLALDAGWDERILAEELAALQADALDLALTGFDEAELEKLLTSVAREVDAAAAGSPEGAASQLGDALTYKIIIECADEAEQAHLLARFEAEGLRCTAWVG